ncbi:MAG: hypothetical protein NT061_03920 [Spirochaetes bacterium]|nr:hypothetical protein [Spirochaetota bacterium]
MISIEAWQDGFFFSSKGMGTLRHSSKHPAIFLGFPRGNGIKTVEALSWKGLGACSLTRTGEDRALLRFASPWKMEFVAVREILRISFLPAQDSAIGRDLGFRLRFGLPGWDHVYGFGPGPVFDSAGRKVDIDPSAGDGTGKKPIAFDRKGSWLAVSDGGGQSLRFLKSSTDLRCSSIPSELALCAPISPAKGMAALTGYRWAPAGGERPVLPRELGREAGPDAAGILRVLLSSSFVGEGFLYLPIEAPRVESKAEKARYRFTVETSAFGPVFSRLDLGSNLNPAQAALYRRMAAVFEVLAPYREHCVDVWKTEGIPLWSHPGIRFPGEDGFWARDDQFMFGPDILLAPTLETGKGCRNLSLPEGEWVHLWTSRRYGSGSVVIDAPVGLPAAFYRLGSDFTALFQGLRNMATRL